MVDYIKLDTEGEELKILNDIEKFIFKVKLIQFEFGTCNVHTRTFFIDYWNYFKKNKFDIYRINPQGATKIYKYSYLLEHFRTTNYIALNRSI